MPLITRTGRRRAMTFIVAGTAVAAAMTQAPVRPAAASGPGIAFAHEVAVDPQRLAGEPNVAVADNTNELYASSPWGFSTTTSFAWKSEDGGAQWDSLHACLTADQHATCTRGGGDSEIQLGTPQTPGGPQAAYFADLNGLDTISCAYSYDGGNTFNVAGTTASAGVPVNPVGGQACNSGSGQAPGSDRQWIAVWPKADNGTGSDILYMAYDTGETPPGNDDLIYSVDAGKSWQKGASLFQGSTNYPLGNVDGTRPGPLVINKTTGVLYEFFERYTGGTVVEVSCDHGLSFTQHDIAPAGTFAHGTTNDFVAGAIDNAGNLYSVWSVSNGSSLTSTGNANIPYTVYYSHSTDGDSTPSACGTTPVRGTTWSRPVPLNYTGSPAPGVTGAVMPWITAGDPGRVDVAYYGTTQALPYDPNTQSAPWYVHMSQTLNGLSTAPSFTDVVADEVPMHNSSICFNGIACTGTGNRNLSDFFEVKTDALGRADIIFTNDNNSATAASTANGFPGGPMVNFVQQSAGPGLYASVNNGQVLGPAASLAQSVDQRNAVTDPPGDATLPAHAAAPGANVDAADITGVKVLPKDSTTFKVLITVKDLSKGPTSAIVQQGNPHTGASWVAEWRRANDVWFAAATVDASGSTSFFAGKPLSEPITGGSPKALGYISNPGTSAAAGQFSNATNTIEIDVPASAVSVTDGNVLTSLQGFTFDTGGGQGESAPFADQVDATAPIDAVVSLPPAVGVPEAPAAALFLLLGLGSAAGIARLRRRGGHRH